MPNVNNRRPPLKGGDILANLRSRREVNGNNVDLDLLSMNSDTSSVKSSTSRLEVKGRKRLDAGECQTLKIPKVCTPIDEFVRKKIPNCYQENDPRKFEEIFTGKVSRDIKVTNYNKKAIGRLNKDPIEDVCCGMCRRKPRSTCRSNTKGTQTRYRESSAQTRPYLPEIANEKGTYEHLEIYKVSKLLKPSEDPGVSDVRIIERARRRWQAVKENLRHLTKSPDKIIIEAFEWEEWIAREEEILATQMARMGIVVQRFEEREKEMRNASAKRIALYTHQLEEKVRKDTESSSKKQARTARLMEKNFKKVSRRWRKEDIVESMTDYASELYAPQMRYGINGNRRHYVGYRHDFDQRMDDLEEEIKNRPIPLICPLNKHNELAKPKGRAREIETGFCKDKNLAKIYENLTNLRKQSETKKSIKCLKLKEKSKTPQHNKEQPPAKKEKENEKSTENKKSEDSEDDDNEPKQYQPRSSEERMQIVQACENKRLADLRNHGEKQIERILRQFEGEIIGFLLSFLSYEKQRLFELENLKKISAKAIKERQIRMALEYALRSRENLIREENESIFAKACETRGEFADYISNVTMTNVSRHFVNKSAREKLTYLSRHIDAQVRRFINSPEGKRSRAKPEMVCEWIKKLVFSQVEACSPDRRISCLFREIPFSSIDETMEAFEVVDHLLNELIYKTSLIDTFDALQVLTWLMKNVIPFVKDYIHENTIRAVNTAIEDIFNNVCESVGISEQTSKTIIMYRNLMTQRGTHFGHEQFKLIRTSHLAKTLKRTSSNRRQSEEAELNIDITLDHNTDFSQKKLKRLSRFTFKDDKTDRRSDVETPRGTASERESVPGPSTAGTTAPSTPHASTEYVMSVYELPKQNTEDEVNEAISGFYKRVSFYSPGLDVAQQDSDAGIGGELHGVPSYYDLFDEEMRVETASITSDSEIPEVFRTAAAYDANSMRASLFDPSELREIPAKFDIFDANTASKRNTENKDKFTERKK